MSARDGDKDRLKEFVCKQSKTPEEIAEIVGTSTEKVGKVLRRLNLLQIGKKEIDIFLNG